MTEAPEKLRRRRRTAQGRPGPRNRAGHLDGQHQAAGDAARGCCCAAPSRTPRSRPSTSRRPGSSPASSPSFRRRPGRRMREAPAREPCAVTGYDLSLHDRRQGHTVGGDRRGESSEDVNDVRGLDRPRRPQDPAPRPVAKDEVNFAGSRGRGGRRPTATRRRTPSSLSRSTTSPWTW